MPRRADVVTSTDLALLHALGEERSVVAASRRIGISRDRAVYRIARLERAFGGPVVASERGGRRHGASQLTELGDRVMRGGFDSVELIDARPVAPPPSTNFLEGTYRRTPHPRVELGEGVSLRVAFAADEGEPVALRLDPDSILVARRWFPTSARNVLPVHIDAVLPGPGPLGRTLRVRAGPARLRVTVTPETVRQLGLRTGSRVHLYVKATALRRVARRRSVDRPTPRAGRR
jgi:molybdate transport system regulatory protein